MGCGLVVMARVLFLATAPVTPRGGAGRGAVIAVAKGATLATIAALLEERRIIRNRHAFIALARYRGVAGRLQAGEYELSSGMSPEEVLSFLIEGRVKLRRVTVREGLTYWQTADRLEAVGVVDRQSFTANCRDARVLAALSIPADSCEGYLFPETYLLPNSISAAEVVRLMVRRFFEVLPRRFAARAQALGLSAHEAIIMASLIEAEAKFATERSLISSVYHNRLRKRMLLQCDPTVIYAIGESFDGDIRRADLQLDSPYNTYRYPGLPPGPIANPGRASLEAAVAPADSPYYYFVARRDGGHHFSQTLSEHALAVRKYQLGR
ncbi:MAG: endolytic transglycosylase MltG [Candidatus Schekmanbacteria bacterium]|nr:endolytic transglycosylase MltG [Candidatus Schekmanbacteria bacterium]